jgi:integrase/recombinase XerD
MKMSNTKAVLANAIELVKEKNPQVGASLERWNRSLSAAGRSEGYRLFLVNHVKRFLAWNDWRLEPKRMEAFFIHLSDAQVPFEERKGCARSLKLFLRYSRKPLPAILKTRLSGRPKQLVRTDLLSDEEIQALIDVAQRPRDKALVAVLYDSGARIEEVASLRYEDVRPHPDYNAFTVVIRKSKTQERENILFEAFPYLRDYMNVHPTKKPGPLWLGQMNGRPFEPFTKAAIANLIRGLVKRAKDDGRIPQHRRIWPHLFRHTRTTRLLEMGFSETKLKQRLGWTLASSMLSRYVHLAAEADADEEAKVHGIEVVPKKGKEGLRHRVCPFCEAPNAPGNAYCAVCGEAMDAEERKARLEERTQQFLELLESGLSPEGKRMFMKLLASGQSNKVQFYKFSAPADDGDDKPEKDE